MTESVGRPQVRPVDEKSVARLLLCLIGGPRTPETQRGCTMCRYTVSGFRHGETPQDRSDHHTTEVRNLRQTRDSCGDLHVPPGRRGVSRCCEHGHWPRWTKSVTVGLPTRTGGLGRGSDRLPSEEHHTPLGWSGPALPGTRTLSGRDVRDIPRAREVDPAEIGYTKGTAFTRSGKFRGSWTCAVRCGAVVGVARYPGPRCLCVPVRTSRDGEDDSCDHRTPILGEERH